MVTYLYTVSFASMIILFLRVGILIGAKRYGDEETSVAVEIIGLVPYLIVSAWGLIIIIKGY